MRNSILSLVAFVASLQAGLSALIPTQEENIRSNLIGDAEDSVEGLLPPKPLARDHYALGSGRSVPEPKHPYVVEISRRFLKFQTEGFPPQYIRLTPEETEGVQNLSLAIVELLNESKISQAAEEETDAPDRMNVNPVFTLSTSGISLRFVEEDSEDQPETEETSSEDRSVVWDFLTRYARNVFLERAKELGATPEWEQQQPRDAFGKFADAIWRMAKLSVDHAETHFDGWTTSATEQTTEEPEETSRATVATVFAYEEPSSYHVFPSQESEYRRKDVDSIFYGRGII